jgi:hypothetical protein
LFRAFVGAAASHAGVGGGTAGDDVAASRAA